MSTLHHRRAALRRRHRSPHEPTRLALLVAGLLAALADWRRRVRARAELLRFSDRQLRDIGVTRADVEHEYAKPFWRD
ncbi:MAG: DUF1127 domain-containing protein [Stellaceae bacterium]